MKTSFKRVLKNLELKVFKISIIVCFSLLFTFNKANCQWGYFVKWPITGSPHKTKLMTEFFCNRNDSTDFKKPIRQAIFNKEHKISKLIEYQIEDSLNSGKIAFIDTFVYNKNGVIEKAIETIYDDHVISAIKYKLSSRNNSVDKSTNEELELTVDSIVVNYRYYFKGDTVKIISKVFNSILDTTICDGVLNELKQIQYLKTSNEKIVTYSKDNIKRIDYSFGIDGLKYLEKKTVRIKNQVHLVEVTHYSYTEDNKIKYELINDGGGDFFQLNEYSYKYNGDTSIVIKRYKRRPAIDYDCYDSKNIFIKDKLAESYKYYHCGDNYYIVIKYDEFGNPIETKNFEKGVIISKNITQYIYDN